MSTRRTKSSLQPRKHNTQSFVGMIDREFNAWYNENYPAGLTSLRKQLKKTFHIAYRKGMQWVRENE